MEGVKFLESNVVPEVAEENSGGLAAVFVNIINIQQIIVFIMKTAEWLVDSQKYPLFATYMIIPWLANLYDTLTVAWL